MFIVKKKDHMPVLSPKPVHNMNRIMPPPLSQKLTQNRCKVCDDQMILFFLWCYDILLSDFSWVSTHNDLDDYFTRLIGTRLLLVWAAYKKLKSWFTMMSLVLRSVNVLITWEKNQVIVLGIKLSFVSSVQANLE